MAFSTSVLRPIASTMLLSSKPFAISNALKDFDYYRQMSAQAGAQVEIADGVYRALSKVVEKGAGDAYVPELVQHFRKG